MFQPSLFVGMVRQGALNQRHYTFTLKANAIAKVQAYLAYHGPVCSVAEACQKCSVNHLNFKLKKAGAMAEKQLEKKEKTKKSTHGGALLSLLGPITGELLHFFKCHEQGILVDYWQLSIKAHNYPKSLNPLLKRPR